MDLASRFYKLFEGNDRAHGTFDVQTSRERDGKQQGKAFVLREPTTEEHWERHLRGEKGLGIIPIRDDHHCMWGAIDVDVYDLNHASLIKQVEALQLPAVLCRSKSGGAHMFFFFQKEVPAEHLQPKLMSIAARLGFAGCEVFPKQQKILVERGDTGNFLNMPYFAGNLTTRYGFNDKAESLSPSEFLDFAESRVIDPDQFLDIEVAPKKSEEVLPKGPPCLQQLAAEGFGEGGRNNALFNLGVYARMAKGEKWEEAVRAYNRDMMKPPLPDKEVDIVIAQLGKKEYFYKCDDQPIVSFCNKEVCITRRYGIGPGQRAADLGSMTKINGDPPIWILDVDGQRVELSTDSLVNQKAFQKDCLNQINMFPKTMSDKAWQARMQVLLSTLTIVDVPPEETDKGKFEYLLRSFCCDRARGVDREEVLQGIAVWVDDTVLFQLRDLDKHLKASGFTKWTDVKIGQFLSHEVKASVIRQRVKGRVLRLWSVPQEYFAGQADTKIELPPLAEDVL